ncbi:tudor domain-containing protein 5 isoform X2 [Cynoglossus semilaevis]|uniref:Tudor domain-containing protein 5 n=1 Tax=Cynoglossus semilaevis TaxID=244447 RepID=A0A3P8WFZ3_CYNSE|nr:tudor domain-containing protein 5 isoform X2 [Cynoglossus semilaevis]
MLTTDSHIEHSAKMSQQEVLAELKKDIRSLLTSSKIGLDPEQLRRDYVELLGRPLPLKPLGFRNIMDMVKEMPDTVSVDHRADGSTYLKAVGNDATKKIQELVVNQRTCKADKKIRSSSARYTSTRLQHTHPFVVLPRKGHVPPPVPAQLRTQLRILLSQGPLRLSDLESCYLRCFGQPLRVHSYGFYSTGEMLGAAPDLVMIQQSRVGSVVVLRDCMLPRSLQIWSKSTVKKPQTLRTDKPTVKGQPASSQSTTAPDPQSPVIQEPAENKKEPKESVTESNRTNCADKNQEHETRPKQEDHHPQQCLQKLEEELHQCILEAGVVSSISEELKDKLQKVVGRTSAGLSVHALPAEYKKLFGEELPLQQSGFFSVTELLSAMSNIFHLKPAEGDRGQDLRVTLIQGSHATLQENGSDVKQPHMKSHFNSKISPWESKLQVDNENIMETITEDLEIRKDPKIQKVVPGVYTDIQVHNSPTVPLDAMQSQYLQPPTRHDARELVQVLVEHVESPGKFYIRFCNTEEAQAMEEMMIDMRRFYSCSDVAQRYHLPKRFIRQGQVCCVSPVDLWFYRVVIHKTISPTEVQVYFVDYGDTTVVLSHQLMFLKFCYSVIPAQAVPSSLAAVKPSTGSWTDKATSSFHKLCCDRPLVGALDCYTGDVLQLFLCDTHTAEDVYVHTALILQGHATPCSCAESEALCVQFSPVSLYLGKGTFHLPELAEELTSTEQKRTQQHSSSAKLKGKEEEIPAPEFIKNWEDQALSCDEQGQASETKGPSTVPTSPTESSPSTIPDLVQPEAAPTETLRKVPQVIQHSSISSSCSRTQKKEHYHPKGGAPLLVKPQPILMPVNSNTSYLGHLQDSRRGAALSLLQLRNSSILFPLFGPR